MYLKNLGKTLIISMWIIATITSTFAYNTADPVIKTIQYPSEKIGYTIKYQNWLNDTMPWTTIAFCDEFGYFTKLKDWLNEYEVSEKIKYLETADWFNTEAWYLVDCSTNLTYLKTNNLDFVFFLVIIALYIYWLYRIYKIFTLIKK